MNYLSWGETSFFCQDLYSGAVFFNFFLKNSIFLLFITLVSIFAYYFIKKFQDKKLFLRVLLSSTKCLILWVIYFVFSLFLVLMSSTYTNDEVWMSHAQNICLTQGSYLMIFVGTYTLASILTYFNIRIWYSFIDKNKKYMKWINIVFIVIVVVLLIGLMFTEGKLDILNRS